MKEKKTMKTGEFETNTLKPDVGDLLLNEKINELSKKIKHLLDLQAVQDKEIELMREDNEKMVRGARRMLAFQDQIIKKLRLLLAEADRRMEDLINWSEIKYDEAEELLTRINEAIGESERPDNG